ncbi:MAG: HutD family protein [Rhodoferax sp.]|uniref:HutD/Ves family protein n=1 Tax=Rhodoferax sp. TaxID=50421 RepID=UPI002621A467|nr:HutD family protein [Rhodoferax sp.]MDD5336433.1 HutD family protein [Rhodoferax sp.]
MNWNIVQLAEVAPSHWRNGGGVTRELLAWPDSADWVWRMSVAEVAASGPFSRFDGVRRWFAVLCGAGVRLTIDGHLHELTRRSEPLCFDGASAVDCQLLEGATQDFNLMLRGNRASAQMERVSGQLKLDTSVSLVVAVYAMEAGATVFSRHETLTIPAHSLAWRKLPANAAVRVESADALWMEIAA